MKVVRSLSGIEMFVFLLSIFKWFYLLYSVVTSTKVMCQLASVGLVDF